MWIIVGLLYYHVKVIFSILIPFKLIPLLADPKEHLTKKKLISKINTSATANLESVLYNDIKIFSWVCNL